MDSAFKGTSEFKDNLEVIVIVMNGFQAFVCHPKSTVILLNQQAWEKLLYLLSGDFQQVFCISPKVRCLFL